MSGFVNNGLTNAGLVVLAKGASGQQINFTRIVMGKGYLPEGQTISTLTDVIDPVASLDIVKLKTTSEGLAVVGGVFSNSDLDQGFHYRELALYADDPDPAVGEVLYCYGNSGDLAEWIPPSGTDIIKEKVVDIITIIGTATNVTAFIAPGLWATEQEVEDCRLIAIDAHDTADLALETANSAILLINGLLADIAALQSIITQNTAQISTLWDAIFTDITQNPFLIAFADLDGLTVSSGVWNQSLQRLEC